jgi:hypothetical protein
MRKKKEPLSPVDEDDKALFDERVKYWQERLGLNDWRIVRSKKKKTTAMAEIFSRDAHQRVADYGVGNDWVSEPVTPVSIDKTAMHEVLHVFLEGLIQAAVDHGQGNETLAEEHRIIHILERLLNPE